MEIIVEQLPVEVAKIAETVSVEKRNEVQAVLNHVFNGVSKMREQIDSLNMPEIKGEDAQKILSDVKTLLSKVTVFIREKSNLL